MRPTTLRTLTTAASLAAFSLVGCANLTSIDRTTATTTSKAIHLDAKQRLVMTKEEGKVFCAEPSPDALSAFASSVGGGLAIPGTASASVATALSEGVGSIGLRTQSITLLRDAMFRICEAAYNKQIGPLMVAQLHERFQNVTVGLLAIEQLTGAVVARQVLLTGRANANASAAMLDAERYLREAEERERMAIEKHSRSQQTTADSQAAATKKQTAYAGAPCNGAVPANTADPNHKNCTDQRNAVEAANQKLAEAQAQEARNKKAMDRATENRVTAAQSRDVAQSSAEAEASNTGQFSGGQSGSNIDEKTVQHISTAVTSIVETVVNKDHVTDSCLVIISDVVKATKAAEARASRAGMSITAMALSTEVSDSLGFANSEAKDTVLNFCFDAIRSRGQTNS